MSPETSPVLLRAEGLTAGYGKMAILHDVTFEVRVGEMVSSGRRSAWPEVG